VRVNCGLHVDGFYKWNLECEFYGDSRHRLNFDLCKKNKIHHHSYRKSMLKLVKLQSLVAKSCKMRKI
jgi:hypothetical protein